MAGGVSSGSAAPSRATDRRRRPSESAGTNTSVPLSATRSTVVPEEVLVDSWPAGKTGTGVPLTRAVTASNPVASTTPSRVKSRCPDGEYTGEVARASTTVRGPPLALTASMRSVSGSGVSVGEEDGSPIGQERLAGVGDLAACGVEGGDLPRLAAVWRNDPQLTVAGEDDAALAPGQGAHGLHVVGQCLHFAVGQRVRAQQTPAQEREPRAVGREDRTVDAAWARHGDRPVAVEPPDEHGALTVLHARHRDDRAVRRQAHPALEGRRRLDVARERDVELLHRPVAPGRADAAEGRPGRERSRGERDGPREEGVSRRGRWRRRRCRRRYRQGPCLIDRTLVERDPGLADVAEASRRIALQAPVQQEANGRGRRGWQGVERRRVAQHRGQHLGDVRAAERRVPVSIS